MVRPSATGRPLERPLLVLCQRGTVVAAAAAPRAVHDVSRRAHRDCDSLARAAPRARARAAGHFFDRKRDKRYAPIYKSRLGSARPDRPRAAASSAREVSRRGLTGQCHTRCAAWSDRALLLFN